MKSLEIYNKTGIPEWGPPIDELNMDDIITYVRPNTKMSAKWSRSSGPTSRIPLKSWVSPRPSATSWPVSAHSMTPSWYITTCKKRLRRRALSTPIWRVRMHGEYAEMIRTHFMQLVTPTDHKFAALHGAVWSGGSFVYVPPGVSCGDSRCSPISA